MPLTRRQFLSRSACLLASAWVSGCAKVIAPPRFVSDPYTLGVASGYPHAGGFTLWTRLAPQPLAGGGMEPPPVEVQWEVAHDGIGGVGSLGARRRERARARARVLVSLPRR